MRGEVTRDGARIHSEENFAGNYVENILRSNEIFVPIFCFVCIFLSFFSVHRCYLLVRIFSFSNRCSFQMFDCVLFVSVRAKNVPSL